MLSQLLGRHAQQHPRVASLDEAKPRFLAKLLLECRQVVQSILVAGFQTAILAFQFGEFTTPMIPTSGITVGVLALARVPWITWAKWMIPLQLIYLVLALLLLIPPCLMHWQ
ncbi:hypothetical protein ACPJXG_03240 [Janthinobacterium sp. NFX145]|uniref:hypothetical protein n=1 Tax=Janthinobacterium sp. NFX145 TaxID=3415602 RepID=UPI003CC63684